MGNSHRSPGEHEVKVPTERLDDARIRRMLAGEESMTMSLLEFRSALSELLELREAVKAAPSPPIGDTGGVGEAPAAWQHRGPRGGWITTDEKMQWSERALYLRPVPARVEAVDHIADVGKKVDGWQPIETAPKDGTWFLGYSPVTSIEDTIDVWHWDPRAETDGAPGFWVNAADSNLDNFPTHWRPLPSPPALQANPS